MQTEKILTHDNLINLKNELDNFLKSTSDDNLDIFIVSICIFN